MNQPIAVRLYQGTAPEKAALESLCQQWDSREFWPVEEFYISLKIPHTFLLYAGQEDRWQGIVLGREMGGVAELFYIYVDPLFRKQQLGKRLLLAFRAKAWELYQAERAYLEVRPSNQGAIGLYEGMGWKRTGRRARYYANGEDALIYEWEPLNPTLIGTHL